VRASGVDEVVRDGETGVLTKAESREFADAAIGLLLDRERRSVMGQSARAVAERDFSAARQVEAMVGHYERLLAR
jgi:glycosyltransferase involved in cell wall biosynthesis